MRPREINGATADDGPAFKAMEVRWPVYGKHSKPALSPEQWWTELIKQCMLEAGAAEKGECTFIVSSHPSRDVVR
jgi:hypothetical protein